MVFNDFLSQPPEELQPWSGVRDAKEAQPMCIQYVSLLPQPTVTGVEDCLHLNVFTPNVSNLRN